jgi:hypothetical protein
MRSKSRERINSRLSTYRSRSLTPSSTAALHSPRTKKIVSPVNRQRCCPVSQRKVVAPLVCPGTGMSSKSSSRWWRSEKVPATLQVSDTESASSVWQWSEASNVLATQSHVGEAGDVYYLEPGHVPFIEEDSELVEFSPKGEYQRTLEVVERNMAAIQEGQ